MFNSVESIERKTSITIQSTHTDQRFLNYLQSTFSTLFAYERIPKTKNALIGRWSEDDKTDGQSAAASISNHFCDNVDRISHTIKHYTYYTYFLFSYIFLDFRENVLYE